MDFQHMQVFIPLALSTLRTAKYCAWLITVDEVDNG
jgi:hypothetical protein